MSVFTKIVSGELPAYKVAEDKRHLAFLDINPNAKGHTLCILKNRPTNFFDLSKEEYIALMHFFATKLRLDWKKLFHVNASG